MTGLLPAVALAASVYSAEGSPAEVVAFAFDSLRRAIVHSAAKTLTGRETEAYADTGGLLLLLGEMDRVEARRLLIDLVDVYLGEAHESALAYACARQGRRIEADLVAAQHIEASCRALDDAHLGSAQRKQMCLSLRDRSQRIETILLFIRNGRLPTYVL